MFLFSDYERRQINIGLSFFLHWCSKTFMEIYELDVEGWRKWLLIVKPTPVRPDNLFLVLNPIKYLQFLFLLFSSLHSKSVPYNIQQKTIKDLPKEEKKAKQKNCSSKKKRRRKSKEKVKIPCLIIWYFKSFIKYIFRASVLYQLEFLFS